MVNRGSVGWANMSTGPNWTARRRALNCTSPPADLPIARPRPVYRGTGPDRLRGAVTDTRLELGARCQIVSKSGRTWTATVSEPLGAASSGGYLVALVGSEWTPDPDVDADGRHPSDPDWLHDTDADLAPEVDR